eukprot:scaffold6569_cov79-Skeletonema_marinoi.AAC.3
MDALGLHLDLLTLRGTNEANAVVHVAARMKYRVVPGGRGEWLNVNGKLKVGWALREGELSHMCVALPTDTNSDVWRCHQNLVLFSHPPLHSRSGRRKSGLGTMRQRGLELTYCLALLLLLSLHHPNAAIAIRLRYAHDLSNKINIVCFIFIPIIPSLSLI